MKKIAIIGGGASGLMSAIMTAQKGHDVHLFEANAHVGKKILASGNGRCNISNKNLHVNDYFGENPAFVSAALQTFPFEAFETFCFAMGLLLHSKRDGRTYPRSYEAKAVTSALARFALHCGVHIVTDTLVTHITKTNHLFHLHVNSHAYDHVIVATGSEAAPQLGANASGYAIARTFGHNIIPTYPALVQLHLDSSLHRKMAGIKQHAAVTLYIDNVKNEAVVGDILFTRYGISGFAVLDVSRSASLALCQCRHVTIGLDLFVTMPRQKLLATLKQLCHTLENYTLLEILSILIPSKMAPMLLQHCHLAQDEPAHSLSGRSMKSVVNTLKDWRFEVTQTHGFEHAEVSGGGVDTTEINPETMESLHVKGLYFTGEVCDIVGRRGGYNLHFAWASGYLAAQAINAL